MKKDTGKKEWKKETYIKLVQKKKKKISISYKPKF